MVAVPVESANCLTPYCQAYLIALTVLAKNYFKKWSMRNERGQATVEFALTLPFLFLFSICVVQLGSVANDQLALNHAAQVAARAISLADIPDESAQQIAISTVEQTVNLNDVEVAVELDRDTAKVDLRFSREVAVPIIGRLFKRVELRASAVMPRQLATN
jgi:Flp pilus assembly protein TadG